MHQGPGRAGHQADVVGRGDSGVALVRHLLGQKQRLEPVVAFATGGIRHLAYLLKVGKGVLGHAKALCFSVSTGRFNGITKRAWGKFARTSKTSPSHTIP